MVKSTRPTKPYKEYPPHASRQRQVDEKDRGKSKYPLRGPHLHSDGLTHQAGDIRTQESSDGGMPAGRGEGAVLARRGQATRGERAFGAGVLPAGGVAEPAFYAWRRTIEERDGNRTPSVKTGAVKRPAFVPVAVTGESRRESGLVIELAGGRVLRLPESITAQRLAELE